MVPSRPAMPYRRVTAYFLSGTGNSFRVADWLRAQADALGAETALAPIDRAAPRQQLGYGAGQLLGLYFPTHGFMPPWSMIKFLLRLPRGRGAHAVVVATRGCLKLGPVFVPGAAGLAVFLAALVLALKGFAVRAGTGLDMPSNVITLHWGLHPRNVAAIVARARARHARLLAEVFTGGRYWPLSNVIWEAAWGAGILALWPVFPVAYLLIGRVFMAKVMFADRSCRSCGRCARNCPNRGIVMVGGKRGRPLWTRHCEVCLRCMAYCRQRAVSVSHPWAMALFYLTSFISAGALQQGLVALTGLDLALVDMAWEAAALVLVYPALLLLYYPFWALSRVPPFKHLLTYLTLTRYYRRYHEPDTRDRHLTGRRFRGVRDPETAQEVAD